MAKVEPAHQKWAQFDWNWRFGDQNNVRWLKKLSLIERGYFFLEIDKTCRKSFVQSIFLFYPQLWLKWSLPTNDEHNSIEIDDLVTKTMFGDWWS